MVKKDESLVPGSDDLRIVYRAGDPKGWFDIFPEDLFMMEGHFKQKVHLFGRSAAPAPLSQA